MLRPVVNDGPTPAVRVYAQVQEVGKGLYSRWLEELAACRLDPELVILQTVRRKGWDIGLADRAE